MMKILLWLLGFIWWEVGDGTKIRIGLDAIMGMNGIFSLLVQILSFIHNKGILLLQQIYHQCINSIDIQLWSKDEDIRVWEAYVEECERYISHIWFVGININEQVN